MAENLNYNATSLCYNNLLSNCIKYGRLYDWATAMDFDQDCNSTSCSEQVEEPHQGICPDGWHIPSNDEWDVLESFVESDKDCTDCGAKYLKSTVGWIDGGYIGNGKDAYGFAALPGGYSYGIFSDVGGYGYWWSATEALASSACLRGMGHGENVYWFDYLKTELRSVRCVKD